jgi:hypothetical protein
MKAAPIPVLTPIVDGMKLNLTWERYLKGLGDNWVEQNQVKGLTNFKYVINGVICFWSFIGTSETVVLPFTVGLDSVMNGQIVLKGSKTVDLTGPSSGFYFIDPN